MPNHNLKPKSSLKSETPDNVKALKMDSAGAHMIDSVLLVLHSEKVGSVQEKLTKNVGSFDTITYVYVVNKSDKLVGVVSIQELFSANKTSLMKEIMIKDIKTVRQSTHKEKVALVALKNHIKAVPVVDKHGLFKGVVPADAVLSILSNANLEDVLISAGIGSEDNPMRSITETSITYHLKKRFPWLILGLSGSMLITLMVGSFDEMLEQQILLASFIPAIVYMSDASGNQTQTIFIRALTLDNKIDSVFYFLREVKVAIVLGMALSTIMFLASGLIWRLPIISFIFSFSLLMAIIGAAVMAIILPVFLKKIKIDPAVATGPLASVMRDAYSLSIYLFFASLLLRLFG